MKLSCLLPAVALFDVTRTVAAVAIPDNSDLASFQPAQRDADASPSWTTNFADVWKRRGGGGSGGRGGSSSSSSGGSTSSSGPSGSSFGSSSSSGKTGSSSSSGSTSSGKGSSTSSTGGRTSTGSGVAPSFGGGKYYGGGSTVPYRSGSRSTAGIAPFLFVGAGVGALAFWPHPVYVYPYGAPWTYRNATTNQNETKPVKCGCDEYQECGCDDNNSTDYINSVIGNGSYNQLNKSLVTVEAVNGTDTILLNGSLPNGTTASGGTDDANAGAGLRQLAQMAGWWPLMGTVLVMFI